MMEERFVMAPEEAGFLPIRPVELPPLDPRRTRSFTGDGGALLPVPGLLAVEAVRVGDMDLPDTIAFDVPLDTTHTRHVTLAHKGFRLARDLDGSPVLMRSFYSNQGRWQDGARIDVCGTWDGGEQPVPVTVAPAEESEPPARGNGGRFMRRS